MKPIALSLWRQLRNWLGGSAAPALAEGEERRIWVRYPCAANIAFQTTAVPQGSLFAARVQNISRGGISLLVNRRFDPGDLLSLDLPGGESERTFSILAYVIHSAVVGEQEWSLGCNFARVLDDDDLSNFGAKRVKPPDPDHRSWVRFPCHAEAQFYVGPDAAGKARAAQVVDISANGVGLMVEERIDPGALLNLELQDAQAITALTMLACVARVDSTLDGRWILGCNFISELDENQLRALL